MQASAPCWNPTRTLLCLLVVAGCAPKPAVYCATGMWVGLETWSTPVTDGEEIRELDRNGDGIVDQREYYDSAGFLEKEESDSDYDSVFDWFAWYRDSMRIRSEYDIDGDNRSDFFRYYRRTSHGVRPEREERDENADGLIDVWKYYDESGSLEREERDEDADGRVDLWKYYDVWGLLRVGRDTDGDGHIDRWERVRASRWTRRMRRASQGDGQTDAGQD